MTKVLYAQEKNSTYCPVFFNHFFCSVYKRSSILETADIFVQYSIIFTANTRPHSNIILIHLQAWYYEHCIFRTALLEFQKQQTIDREWRKKKNKEKENRTFLSSGIARSSHPSSSSSSSYPLSEYNTRKKKLNFTISSMNACARSNSIAAKELGIK